jgi:eukaryotic-like serine/threonine-protein kinase
MLTPLDLETLSGPPGERWPDDPELAQQVAIWLRARRLAEPPTGPRLGPLADRYEASRLLDVGATGAVWLAYDRLLARTVAIKRFHQPCPDVLVEARAASEVISDHVVRIIDVHPHDPSCLVMELVGEHDLEHGELVCGASAAVVEPRGVHEVIAWLRDVARGVADAHLRNVFHRDLKPRNVLIAPVSRRAKVVDFGLAASMHGRHDDRRGIRIVGTPTYLAPEQARGSAALDPQHPADRAALVAIDVWGIGAIGYALLMRRALWRETAELDPWEVAATADRAPPLEAARGIARQLAPIIRRALAIDPAHRYASAAELAGELDAILAQQPTSFERSPVPRARLWLRRNRRLAVTAAAALALGVLSVEAHHSLAQAREERATLEKLAAELAAACVPSQAAATDVSLTR